MDYEEHFTHLLRHFVDGKRFKCDRKCPVEPYKDSGLATLNIAGSGGGYTGPSVIILFEAMKQMGFVAMMPYSGIIVYYPTVAGIDYLAQHNRPIRFWLQKNWFPAIVAATTISVAAFNAVVTYFF